MDWRTAPVFVRPTGKFSGPAAAFRPIFIVLALSAACLVLLATAPVNGDFWWADAPRHALNGAFVRDFIRAHPVHEPVRWPIDYYLRRPALTIMFYPPIFYVAEAMAFALFGVSQFTAQLTISLFVLLLAASAYRLARLFLPRFAALGAALLVIGTPEAALWGRQVMLDLPAYALIAAASVCLVRYISNGRPAAIYLTLFFLLAAIYTKYNSGFAALILTAVFITAKGRTALRDRHALIASVLGCIGLLPGIVVLRQFGAYNVASVSGLPGTLPLDSLACWLFYVKALPGQLGWLTVLLATGGLGLVIKRFVVGQDRSACVLLLAWLVIGFLFFTLISLKEPRDTTMVLLPLAIMAPLFLIAVLGQRFGEPAALALGAGTLLYTLTFCPVPRVEGYQEVASYLARNVPRDGTVLYSGYRDGNLIFDLATFTGRSDITIVRLDKLLLSAPVGERRRGIKQADYDEATISTLLRNLGATYFVVQPGFWSDLAVMGRFDNVVDSADYVKTAHFELAGNLSTQDGTKGIDILQPTYPVIARLAPVSIDMPLAGQRFEGALHP